MADVTRSGSSRLRLKSSEFVKDQTIFVRPNLLKRLPTVRTGSWTPTRALPTTVRKRHWMSGSSDLWNEGNSRRCSADTGRRIARKESIFGA
jgi:hypothetical protein